MIPQAENQYIEFKREECSPGVLAEEIVAFANSEGGEIWLGVDDNGQVTGISRSYEEDIMNICRASVIPPIQPHYEAIDVFDAVHKVKLRLAKITIPKGVDRPYYTVKNKYYIRVGSTKRIASREELVRLFQAAGLFHYDIVEAGGSALHQLNLSAIAAYFSQYRINFSLEDEAEKKRLLIASDILSKGEIPTVGGLLVFGIRPEKILPQSGISFAVFNGESISDTLRDKKLIYGDLPSQVDNAPGQTHDFQNEFEELSGKI